MSSNFDRMFSENRGRMLTEQLISRGINDERVLDAMGRIPREKFVPRNEIARSYYDCPLPIGNGQTISQPYIVAYMTELLELGRSERILEIGTGSGYQTAVLAEISNEVFTIELIPKLADKAKELLVKRSGYKNIRFKTGKGVDGWNEYAPYKKIIFTAAPEEFPESIFSQLDEGGIIVAPVGGSFQKIIKYVKRDGIILQTELIAVSFVPFIV